VEVSPTSNGRHEEPIQSIPKRVVGFLRKEVVRGVAASKNASACWTTDTVFTWGTNTGQLGRFYIESLACATVEYHFKDTTNTLNRSKLCPAR
jgi:hypothetical protein